MKAITVGIILLALAAMLWTASWASAQAPGPGATPTPTPTPAMWPQEPTGAIQWLISVWRTYGPLAAIVAVIAALVYGVGKAVSSGPLDGLKEWLKKGTIAELERTSHSREQDKRLDRYLESLINKYERLELKNLYEKGHELEVRLGEVYIRLRARGMTTDTEPSRKGTQTALLGEHTKAPELGEWLVRSSNLAVLGRAGSGKSTFLHYATRVLAQARRDKKPERVRESLNATLNRLPIPFYCSLPSLSAYWQDLPPKDRIEPRDAYIFVRFLAHAFERHQFDAAFFEERLREGECFIFLDSLDEVKQDLRHTIVDIVEAFVVEYASADAAHPNHCVVACRPEAHTGEAALQRFQAVTIEPLDTQQIREFIQAWYYEVLGRGGTLSPEDRNEAGEKTKSLLDALARKEQVGELATTPLLLTLLTILHHGQPLPDSRAQIYDKCINLLLDKWEGSKRDSRIPPPAVPADPRKRREFLQPAAFWLLEAGLAEAPCSEWAKEIVQRLKLPGEAAEAQRNVESFLEWAKDCYNIIEEGSTHCYRFAYHRTFQEYLAAEYLVSLGQAGREMALGQASNRDWWETLRLTAACTDTKGQSDLLCRALELTGTDGSLLAASCVTELDSTYLDPQLIPELQQRLVGIMTAPTLPAKDTRALAGHYLGHERLGDPRPDVKPALPVFVAVPTGDYVLGSSDEQVARWNEAAGGNYYDDEKPQHRVSLQQYYMGRFPVTNAQFARFVQTQGYSVERFWTPQGLDWRRGQYKPDLSFIQDENLREQYRQWVEGRTERAQPYYWKNNHWNIPNHPVVGVTWFEAMAYCAWLEEQLRAGGLSVQVWQNDHLETVTFDGNTWRARLPTEAEWEAAARGQMGNEWPWGNTFDNKLANTSESEIGQTTAVGQYPDGASPYGVMDMAGNVWEWCHSLYKDYPYRADDGRENVSSGDPRVVRGGAWYADRGFARCAFRRGSDPDSCYSDVGFRVVLSPNRFCVLGF
jgi:formylglycine-generating enzyme required for sulfatase activity